MPEILHARVAHALLIIRVKGFSTAYPLATVHPLQTDGQTDDNQANSSAVTYVLSTSDIVDN